MQHIGDLKGVKSSLIKQEQTVSADQIIGNIYDSQEVEIIQRVGESVTDDFSTSISMSSNEVIEVVEEAANATFKNSNDLERSISDAKKLNIPNRVRTAIEIVSNLVTVVSGGLALSGSCDGGLLATALPFIFYAGGLLTADGLVKLFSRLRNGDR